VAIKILLVDPFNLCRQGIRALLESDPGVEIVAETSDGHEAVHLAREHLPDLVLIEVGLPGLNGNEATAQIRHFCPQTKVLCLTSQSDPRVVLDMIHYGAIGFVLKQACHDDLKTAIRAARDGKSFFSSHVAGVVVDDHRGNFINEFDLAAPDLSSREREVLQLLAEGHTSREIGAILSISPRTVDTHRRRIMKKLQIRHLAGLVKYALREGLTEP
jgi:two-component system response regulator NreC